MIHSKTGFHDSHFQSVQVTRSELIEYQEKALMPSLIATNLKCEIS